MEFMISCVSTRVSFTHESNSFASSSLRISFNVRIRTCPLPSCMMEARTSSCTSPLGVDRRMWQRSPVRRFRN